VRGRDGKQWIVRGVCVFACVCACVCVCVCGDSDRSGVAVICKKALQICPSFATTEPASRWGKPVGREICVGIHGRNRVLLLRFIYTTTFTASSFVCRNSRKFGWRAGGTRGRGGGGMLKSSYGASTNERF